MKQEEWDSEKALVQVDAATQYIENLMDESRSLRGTGGASATRKAAVNHFLGMDGLFVVEMALKGIISCESNDSKVEGTHSTKYLYERIEEVSADAVKTIDAIWRGSGSFRSYMAFLDGKYNRWRYNFIEVGKSDENIEIHAENMLLAIQTLRHVLSALISAKLQCEECGSSMIKEGVRAYCASCGKRREEYDAEARNHLKEKIAQKHTMIQNSKE